MGRDRTLLIVDDDETFLRGFTRRWKHLGRVYTATDESSAVCAARAAPIDLAIIDFHIPVTGGLEILKRLNAEDLVRFMVMVSSDMTAYLQAVSLAAGANGAFDKGVFESAVVGLLDGTWDEAQFSNDRLDRVVQTHLVRTLAKYGGNHSEAARALGISRSTLDRNLGYASTRSTRTDKL